MFPEIGELDESTFGPGEASYSIRVFSGGIRGVNHASGQIDYSAMHGSQTNCWFFVRQAAGPPSSYTQAISSMNLLELLFLTAGKREYYRRQKEMQAALRDVDRLLAEEASRREGAREAETELEATVRREAGNRMDKISVSLSNTTNILLFFLKVCCLLLTDQSCRPSCVQLSHMGTFLFVSNECMCFSWDSLLPYCPTGSSTPPLPPTPLPSLPRRLIPSWTS